MEFLVNISIATPDTMAAADVDELRRREATRAAELAESGFLNRVWRVPGQWANWGLWTAPDEPSLMDALASLPLHPYMEIEVHRLDPHPSDPGSPATTSKETTLDH
ncbi:muconolactone Delta-isomerase [Aeromicrobium sp. UC242_57]|uniref:muconolactone Delta-isomerase n=1 Tax=Aeromicrobium sp. UC242_57 TaxID=3374624 RepID=UPI0037B24BD4